MDGQGDNLVEETGLELLVKVRQGNLRCTDAILQLHAIVSEKQGPNRPLGFRDTTDVQLLFFCWMILVFSKPL